MRPTPPARTFRSAAISGKYSCLSREASLTLPLIACRSRLAPAACGDQTGVQHLTYSICLCHRFRPGLPAGHARTWPACGWACWRQSARWRQVSRSTSPSTRHRRSHHSHDQTHSTAADRACWSFRPQCPLLSRRAGAGTCASAGRIRYQPVQWRPVTAHAVALIVAGGATFARQRLRSASRCSESREAT